MIQKELRFDSNTPRTTTVRWRDGAAGALIEVRVDPQSSMDFELKVIDGKVYGNPIGCEIEKSGAGLTVGYRVFCRSGRFEAVN